MGRRQLHTTENERKEAKREHDRAWRQTPRGKMMRAQQNRRAYEKRRGPVQLTLRLPYIPKYLEPLAKLDLDLSDDLLLYHFNGGLPLPDDRQTDDDEFIRWDQWPSYNVSAELENTGLTDTISSLHGRRMRLQHLSEADLIHRYEHSNDHDSIWREVHRELVHRLLAFPKARKTVQLFKHESKVDFEMGMHWLQWEAYAILALRSYWVALKGRNPEVPRQVYENKWESAV